MAEDYKIIRQAPTTRINEAGQPVEVVEVMFSFDENRTGVIYITPASLGSDNVKQRILDYITHSRKF